MRNLLTLWIIFGILFLSCGCSHTQNSTNFPEDNSIIPNQTNSTSYNQTPQKILQINDTFQVGTPLIKPHFPSQSVAIPEKYWFNQTIGYFPNNYIVDYECSANNTTFKTDYILITGSDGPNTVRFSLDPLEQKQEIFNGIPLPVNNISQDIVNSGIEPEEFTAEPNHLYITHIVITTRPNLQGYDVDVGQGVALIDPVWSFLVNVSIDGKSLTKSHNVLTIGKYCHFSPGGGLFGLGQMRDSPSVGINQSSIILGSGQTRDVLIIMQNYNGPVRRFDFRIDGSNRSIISTKTDRGDLLKPSPTGMTFSLQSPYLIEENFQDYSNLLKVTVNTDTPPGDYEIPLEVCYRDIDVRDSSSQYFPFSSNESCPFSTTMKIHVNY
jgi:hypothetical protein